MDGRARIDDLLRQLGARLGHPDLVLSDGGTCGLTYKQRMKVVIELPEASDHLHIYSLVMAIPKHAEKKLYRKLLRLNLFCYETNGATFAINEDHNWVVLCYNHVVADLDSLLFETIIENFLLTLDRLFNDLTGDDYSSDDEDDLPDRSMMPSHFIRA